MMEDRLVFLAPNAMNESWMPFEINGEEKFRKAQKEFTDHLTEIVEEK